MRYANYRLPVPAEKQCRVIVDTDAANEGDDQFAVIQAMLSPKFENVGFIAAHFGREGSMEASFQELQRVFQAASCPFTDLIRHGAPMRSSCRIRGRSLGWRLPDRGGSHE